VDSIAAFDVWLFQQINSFVGVAPIFDRFMSTMVNEYFITVTLSLVLVVLWFVGGSAEGRMQNQKAVFYGFLAQAVANGIVAFNNMLYFRPRPFAAMHVNMLFYEPTDSSMPSNPAAVGFAFATAVWMVNRKVGALLYALAALFAFSRVYCGVHYPLDIVGGAAAGIVGAVIAVVLGRTLLNPVFEWMIRLGRRLYLA
jgi:undecaprenyl-diphosphatase